MIGEGTHQSSGKPDSLHLNNKDTCVLLFSNKDLTVTYTRHECYLCGSMHFCLLFDLTETDYIDIAVCLVCLEEMWDKLP